VCTQSFLCVLICYSEGDMLLRVLFAVLLVSGLPSVASAASLYLNPASTTLHRGDSVTVAVRVDVDEAAGECVNAVDGVLTYSESVQPVDISTGESILSMWVEAPNIDAVNRRITFAGGIPNGYCGRIAGDPRLSNVVLEVVFRSPGLQIGGGAAADRATVEIAPESAVYLNDGIGTQASLTTFPATITLLKTPGATLQDDWRTSVQNDDIPPREFSVALERDPVAFNGQYYIVFNTSDKETGISHYEVMEEPIADLGRFSWGRADAPWVTERSPYVLKDQSLNSVVRVRALDKAGNEYVATLVPEESMRTLSTERLLTYILVAVTGALLVIVLIVITLVVRRVRRRKALSVDDTPSVPPPHP
jgi:hypothetical protein